MVRSQLRQIVHKTLSQKQKGPVEWLKVQVLNSNPSTAKKKKKKE
jgi:hypothetical protein